MPIPLTSSSSPVFKTVLTSLAHCLKRAKANAVACQFGPRGGVRLRLAPDMLPLNSQLCIACDTAKNGPAHVDLSKADFWMNEQAAA